MKILLVDDNPNIVKMVTKFFRLKEGNYETDSASNGMEAIAKYPVFKPDFVILDISMPVMDGIETLTKLVEMDKTASVIMASAAGSSDKIDECRRKGAKGFVEKPFAPEELLTIINNLIKSGPTGKDRVTIFSLAGKRIEGSLRKMIEYDVSVELKNVESHKGTSADSVNQIVIPEDSFGFTCELSGQVNGVIVGVIKKEHLFTMCGKEDTVVLPEDEATFFELFNILNNNLIRELKDYMQANIQLTVPRYFISEKDSKFEGKQFIVTNYEIKLADNTYPLSYYIWM